MKRFQLLGTDVFTGEPVVEQHPDGGWLEAAPTLARIERLEAALVRLRDCDFVITLADRMDAVRDIAREALNG